MFGNLIFLGAFAGVSFEVELFEFTSLAFAVFVEFEFASLPFERFCSRMCPVHTVFLVILK